MKRIIGLLLTVAMLATLFVGCASKTDDKTLIIGGSGPLTGDYASYGISVENGAKLAAKEINEAGGIAGFTVEVQMEDDQADPAMAVNAYAKLIDAGMHISLGSVTSGACVATVEETQADGILMLTPSASQKEATQYPNAFRVCFTDPAQGVYASDFIKDNGIAAKVAVLYDNSNDYSNGIAENFISTSSENGLEIVETQTFTDQSKTDFTVQLEAVKKSGAELLFLPIYAQEAAYILTQAEDIGLDVIFFGCDGLDGIIEKIGEENLAATEGVMLLTPFAADSTDEVSSAFVAAYKASYEDATPDQFAAGGYDAVYAIKAAVEKAGITDLDAKDFNEKVIAAMTEIEIKGATGTMKWTADGESEKTANAVTIVNGVYEAYN